MAAGTHGRADVRRDRDRALRGRAVGLCGTDAGRVHTGEPGTTKEKLRPLETPRCPFANLPEARSGRWGEGLTAEKMKECVWVRPNWWRRSSSWSGRRRGICDMRGSWA